MIKILRHEENIPREDDGAARFDDLIEKFKVKFVGYSGMDNFPGKKCKEYTSQYRKLATETLRQKLQQ